MAPPAPQPLTPQPKGTAMPEPQTITIPVDECIVWSGAKNAKGYGHLYHDGRKVLAHRLAFCRARGYWPNICRHACDNPACVNPDHLLDGTVADNNRDMFDRGRFVPPTLNFGMPSRTADEAAYRREKRFRQRAGTWVYRADDVAVA